MAEQKTVAHAPEHYTRFSVAQRIEHIVLLVSFSVLGVTGLIQKFSTSPISQAIINLLGGIEPTRIIHRTAAIIFVALCLYHALVLGYKVFVKRAGLTMLPGLGDATNAIDVLRYNLGLSKEHPKMPRYNFAEKMEYWALVWGGIVMAMTGFILWNPIATARFVPGTVIPAAKAAHGAEAILAVLAIIIWHFYSVHLKFFNKSMFTGKMTRHQMEEEHGAELEAILAGTGRPPADPAGVRRRERIYVPIALLVGLILAFGLYWFTTFEQTAIASLPPAATQVPVFVPLTGTPGATSTIENNQIGVPIPHEIAGREQCDTCHGPDGVAPYPANHAGRPNESCTICHAPGPTPTPGGEQPAGGAGQPKTIPHAIDDAAHQDCTACHGEGKIKPYPANHKTFTNDSCTACHQVAAGTPAAEGAAAATPEAGSTAAAGGPPAMPANHDPNAAAYKDCTVCHGEGKVKPFPANHASFPADSCTSCHQPASATGSTPAASETSAATPEAGSTAAAGGPPAMPANHDPNAAAYKDCTVCHGEGKVKPFPANHASFPADSCTSCHQPASATGGASSSTPAPGGSASGAAPLIPAFHDLTSGAYTDCTKCHGEGKIRPFPANHVSFSNDQCTSCHQLAEQ
jgi:cytochrome b subunit of formate dehydrogenase